jgi:hypothetical protein
MFFAMSQPQLPGTQTPFLLVGENAVSKTRVDRAGRSLREGTPTDEDYELANEFRRPHSNPMLSVRMSYTSFATTLGIPNFVVSQRLKRIERIEQS